MNTEIVNAADFGGIVRDARESAQFEGGVAFYQLSTDLDNEFVN